MSLIVYFAEMLVAFATSESKFAAPRHKIDTEINRIPIRLTDISVTGTRKYHYANTTSELLTRFFPPGLQHSLLQSSLNLSFAKKDQSGDEKIILCRFKTFFAKKENVRIFLYVSFINMTYSKKDISYENE